MTATMACIAGEELFRQIEGGNFNGRWVERLQTPFGKAADIFRVDADPPFFLLPRYRDGMDKTPADRIGYRANLYALKELGVNQVLSWSACGAITHNIQVGDMVILDDLIDRTHLRPRTFFENSPLGILRQFPVFCPRLRELIAKALGDMELIHHASGTAAVTEGPRLETPAEVKMLGAAGAHVVTHHFAPEVFLAKELEMCYSAVCYVVNYAETGSRHRPFTVGELFGGLQQKTDRQRLASAMEAMNETFRRTAGALAVLAGGEDCECLHTMDYNRRTYGLSDDWHAWFEQAQGSP